MKTKYKYLYAEANYGQEEIDSVMDTLNNQRYSLMGGEKTKDLEIKVSKIFGMKYGLMTNSGSSSNLLAIKSFNFSKGEVITPALTFSTTISPIIHCGLKPVFVDVDIKTLQIDTNLIQKAINANTVAIMVPNLIGNVAEWQKLREIADSNHLALIEDSADTIGYKFNLGKKYKKADVCTTSFYASHVITGAGFGGMVCFNNEKNLKVARTLRSWGRRSANYNEKENYQRRFNCKIDGIRYDDKYVFDDLGYNFIGSDLSAAFALCKIKKLNKNINRRIENFNKLKKMFQTFEKNVDTFNTTKGYKTGWLAFPFMLKNDFLKKRTSLQIKLEKSNIQTRTIFSGNITRQPVAKKFKWKKVGSLKNSNKIMSSGILIGCHELIDDNHIEYLYKKLDEFFNKK